MFSEIINTHRHAVYAMTPHGQERTWFFIQFNALFTQCFW